MPKKVSFETSQIEQSIICSFIVVLTISVAYFRLNAILDAFDAGWFMPSLTAVSSIKEAFECVKFYAFIYARVLYNHGY